MHTQAHEHTHIYTHTHTQTHACAIDVKNLLFPPGNILVILVIIFNSEIHDAYYYFIASYASSDILTAFTYTPR